jgi:hypothetical protein
MCLAKQEDAQAGIETQGSLTPELELSTTLRRLRAQQPQGIYRLSAPYPVTTPEHSCNGVEGGEQAEGRTVMWRST